MRKLALLLTVLLLALPVYGQDSVNTEQQYIRQLWSAYTPSGSTKTADIEVPSWASGAVFSIYTDDCTGCTADLRVKSYRPNSALSFSILVSTGLITSTGWTCTMVHPNAIDASTCTKIRLLLPAGTNILSIEPTAGTMSTAAWVRWMGRPK